MAMFPAVTYQDRRAALLAALRERGARGLVLLPGNVDSPMNYRDNAYDFRQDSNFLYFCGLAQPGLALVLDLDDDRATLHGDDIGLDDLVWTGPLPGIAERAAQSGLASTAPACWATSLLPRKSISVGMLRIWYCAASACSASVSTLRKRNPGSSSPATRS